ncbi:13411_t:CDS:2, partial [Cetraspora pellucida]
TESAQSFIISIPHSNILLNEYQDQYLFSAAFPVLYSYGVESYEAIEQVQNKKNITNSVILELLKNINIACSKLMTSHQSHLHMHNKIHAIIIQDGTPSLFIMINPANLHSPIVMMYIGNKINIEKLTLNNFSKVTERS